MDSGIVPYVRIPHGFAAFGTAAVAVVLFASNLYSQEPTGTAVTKSKPVEKSCSVPELRKELLTRVKKDQEIRKKAIVLIKDSGLGFGVADQKAIEKLPGIQQLKAVDQDNCRWIKNVVEEHGWPGKSAVGTDGAQAAFLLVQHADHDHEFQKKCLELMEKAPNGELDRQSLAFLSDRVRAAEGKGQLYGTQIEMVDDRWQPMQVEDPDKLDERRAAMGLPPMKEYLRQVEQMYGPPK